MKFSFLFFGFLSCTSFCFGQNTGFLKCDLEENKNHISYKKIGIHLFSNISLDKNDFQISPVNLSESMSLGLGISFQKYVTKKFGFEVYFNMARKNYVYKIYLDTTEFDLFQNYQQIKKLKITEFEPGLNVIFDPDSKRYLVPFLLKFGFTAFNHSVGVDLHHYEFLTLGQGIRENLLNITTIGSSTGKAFLYFTFNLGYKVRFSKKLRFEVYLLSKFNFSGRPILSGRFEYTKRDNVMRISDFERNGNKLGLMFSFYL